ncbi:MAG: hypothetical protein IBJ11_03380 [Phycisphaerales bacterium]|nr:hypothetical protein [Phycisphaerales bacterium]
MTTAIHRRVEDCAAGRHPAVIARMPSGWAVLGDAQFLEGYSLLLPDPVVGQLNDLTGAARRQYLDDLARLGDAVLAVCRPRRLNYEILGNLEPALHAHVFPRYAHEADDLRTKPVWSYPASAWTDRTTALDPARHGGLLARLRAAIGG